MLIGEMPQAELAARLRGDGIHLDTGAFTTRVRSDLAGLAEPLAQVYADYRLDEGPTIDDFRVSVVRRGGRLALGAPRAQAMINGRPAFPPFPPDLVLPMFESTLNWCIARQVYRYVTFHAAAAERDERAVILIGPSGAGKSTLCAALIQRGWRLLSDELVLLRPQPVEVVANPRPISLKNEAIRLIAGLGARARFSARCEGTNKGTIAFLRPPLEALARAKVPARPTLVLAPAYRPEADPGLRELSKAEGFMALVHNSVNYFSTLRAGFDALVEVAERCRFYELNYRDLDEAVATIDRLHGARAAGDEAA